MKFAPALGAAFALFCAAGDAHAQWINAGNQSCDFVCSRAGRPAARSGIYMNGFPFFICAGNAAGQGFRAGYNLKPNWANACIVGWGGREVPVRPYRCLCSGIGPV
jgi:hypothetical protein